MIVFVIFFGGTNADISKYWVGIMILDILCCRSQQAFSVPPSSFYFFFFVGEGSTHYGFCVRPRDRTVDCCSLRLKHRRCMSSTPSSKLAVILLVLSWKCSHVSRLLFCLYEEASICRSKKKERKEEKEASVWEACFFSFNFYGYY